MSRVNELLEQLDDAFDTAEGCAQEAAKVRAAAAAAIEKIQAQLDSLKADQAAKVQTADDALAAAQAMLAGIRDQVNARVGALTAVDPRVSVR